MRDHKEDFGGDERSTLKISRPMLLLGIPVLTGLVVFVVVLVGEMERFALLLSHAEPAWLILAVVLQAGAYLCAGVIWNEVTRPRASNVRTPGLVPSVGPSRHEATESACMARGGSVTRGNSVRLYHLRYSSHRGTSHIVGFGRSHTRHILHLGRICCGLLL
jgi:hypothetical protein